MTGTLNPELNPGSIHPRGERRTGVPRGPGEWKCGRSGPEGPLGKDGPTGTLSLCPFTLFDLSPLYRPQVPEVPGPCPIGVDISRCMGPPVPVYWDSGGPPVDRTLCPSQRSTHLSPFGGGRDPTRRTTFTPSTVDGSPSLPFLP